VLSGQIFRKAIRETLGGRPCSRHRDPARDEEQSAGFFQAVTPILKRLILALAVAAVPAIVVFVPTIAGVSTWKWVLGIVGLMIFMLAGRQGRP